MNIFDIDVALEQKIESIINLKKLIDGIEEGTVVVVPEDAIKYITELYASYTDPITIPSDVTYCYFNFDNSSLQQVYECLVLALDVEINKLTLIEEDLDKKLDSYSYIVKQSEIDAASAKDEAKRFKDKADSALATSKKLRELLVTILEKYGDIGKSNNYTKRTEKFNLYTTTRNSVEVDELFSDDDSCNYTDVSFRMPTSDYNAFIALINENPEVLEDVNLDQINFDTIKTVQYVDKTRLANRLKQSEVIVGVSLVPSTSVTIR